MKFSYSIQYTPTPPPSVGSSGSWGLGEYGLSHWGANPDAEPPFISSVPSNLADTAGGTVVTIIGTGFSDPATIELLTGGVVVGTGVIADPLFDLTATRIYAGMPALAAGFYDLRVSTPGGYAVRTNAVEFRPFAAELKVETTRRKWARAWNLAVRLLAG